MPLIWKWRWKVWGNFMDIWTKQNMNNKCRRSPRSILEECNDFLISIESVNSINQFMSFQPFCFDEKLQSALIEESGKEINEHRRSPLWINQWLFPLWCRAPTFVSCTRLNLLNCKFSSEGLKSCSVRHAGRLAMSAHIFAYQTIRNDARVLVRRGATKTFPNPHREFA